MLYLSRFDFIPVHVQEKSMEKVNRLSKRPDLEVGIERDNKDRKLIK